MTGWMRLENPEAIGVNSQIQVQYGAGNTILLRRNQPGPGQIIRPMRLKEEAGARQQPLRYLHPYGWSNAVILLSGLPGVVAEPPVQFLDQLHSRFSNDRAGRENR